MDEAAKTTYEISYQPAGARVFVLKMAYDKDTLMKGLLNDEAQRQGARVADPIQKKLLPVLHIFGDIYKRRTNEELKHDDASMKPDFDKFEAELRKVMPKKSDLLKMDPNIADIDLSKLKNFVEIWFCDTEDTGNEKKGYVHHGDKCKETMSTVFNE